MTTPLTITSVLGLNIPTQTIATGGVAYGATNSIFYSGGNGGGITLTGVAYTPATGDNQISPFDLFIASDTCTIGSSGNQSLNWLSVNGSINTGAGGSRTAIQGRVNIASPLTITSGYGYQGMASITRVGATLGGTSGAYSNYMGGCYGFNANVFLEPGATYIQNANGCEFDVAISIGASSAEKHGITIVQTGTDSINGTYDDSAISFSTQSKTTVTFTASVGGATTGVAFQKILITSTATGGSTTTLIDTSQAWATNAYVGDVVYDSTGGAIATITANTATTLTFAAVGTAPVSGDTYYIGTPILIGGATYWFRFSDAEWRSVTVAANGVSCSWSGALSAGTITTSGIMAPWTYGINFGSYPHSTSFWTPSTLIGYVNQVSGGAQTATAGWGINWSNVSFANYSLLLPGFSVDPTGTTTVQSGSAPSSSAAVGIRASSTANLGVFFGPGAPTFSAAEGSIYSNTTGTSGARLYLNTSSGSGSTWTAATTP
jgi:hypothetical protein